MLNTVLIVFFIFFVMVIQNSFWPLFFGTVIPLYLWIPCLIYSILYRSTGIAVGTIYFLSWVVAVTSTILVSHLLLIHSLIFLTVLFFKRVYYVSFTFFSIACAMSVFVFPILLGVLSVGTGGDFFFPKMLSWIGGSVLTWLMGFPLLGLFLQIDQLFNYYLQKMLDKDKIGV